MGEEPDASRPEEPPPQAATAEGKPGLWARIKGWAAGRRDQTEHNWRFLDAEVQRTRLLAKVVALHMRYTFGYLAFGFLVSAPIQLGFRHEAGWLEGLLKSIVLGGLFAVPSLVLWPMSTIDWGRMRIPEFKNLELALTRWAAIGAALWLLVAFVVEKVVKGEGYWAWPCDVRVAWTNLGLMFFSWVRVKFHTIMFREFYTLKPDDDLVLRVPPSRLKLFSKDIQDAAKLARPDTAAEAGASEDAPSGAPAETGLPAAEAPARTEPETVEAEGDESENHPAGGEA